MIEKNIKITVDSKEAVKGIDNVTESIDGTTEATSELSGTLDKFTGGAASKLKGFTQGLVGVAKGFKSVGAAIAASGIGLLVLAITAITQAFKRSEEGQNKFAKFMGVIGAVTNQVLDLIADLGEVLISVFENPQQAIKSLGDSIQSFFIEKINFAIEGLGLLGSAFGKLLDGDIKGALGDVNDGLIQINRGLNPLVIVAEGVTDGIIAATEATTEFIKETEREARIAAQIADKRAQAEKNERKLLVERAEANRDIADLREKAARRDEFNAEERIKFLTEAGAIEEEITNKEIENARLLFEAKQAENALGKSTAEDKKEEAQLQANLITLETQRLNLQKRLNAEILTSQREQKAKVEAEIKAEETRLKTIEDLRIDFDNKELERQAQTDEQKLQLERDRAQQSLDILVGTEEEKRQAQLALDEFYDAKEVELAKKTAKEKEEVEKQEAEKKIQIDKAVANAKIGLAGDTLGAINGFLKEGSEAQKGVAVAQTTIDTWQAAQASFTAAQKNPISTLFPAYPFIQSGIAVASGLANVKKILSTDASGGGSTSASAPSTPQAPSAPSFNLVQGTGANQIAEGIQDQAPTKAYVVSTDMTSAQSLDRNIEESATL